MPNDITASGIYAPRFDIILKTSLVKKILCDASQSFDALFFIVVFIIVLFGNWINFSIRHYPADKKFLTGFLWGSLAACDASARGGWNVTVVN